MQSEGERDFLGVESKINFYSLYLLLISTILNFFSLFIFFPFPFYIFSVVDLRWRPGWRELEFEWGGQNSLDNEEVRLASLDSSRGGGGGLEVGEGGRGSRG